MEREMLRLPCPKIVRGQERLMPEQETYAREFAQERMDTLLSLAGGNESEAEKHLRQIYLSAEQEPVRVRWFDSPFAFCNASIEDFFWDRLDEVVLFSELFSVDGFIESELHFNDENWIEENVWWSVYDIFEDKINRIWNNIRAGVWGVLEDSMWTGAWGNSLYNFLPGTGSLVSDIVSCSLQAYAEQGNQSLCQFFHHIYVENKAIHLARFIETISGYRLGRKEAWLVRKPGLLELDERGRLHSANGMCIQYRDGWGFYAWHGVCVPAQVILHPEHLTREGWVNERNMEVRRAIQERLGPERFIALVGGTRIDRSPRGELVAVELGNDPEGVAHYVQVQDASTQRQYYLRVPPNITSADEAVAWTFGLSGQEYQPAQET
jgi:hypothetical protein